MILLGVLVVLGGWALLDSLLDVGNNYRSYRQSKDFSARIHVASLFLAAVQHLAYERGSTAVALRGAAPFSDEMRAFLDERRRLGDAALDAAFGELGGVSESIYPDIVKKRHEIERLRRQVDREALLPLASRDAGLAERWYTAANDHILAIQGAVERLVNSGMSGDTARRLTLLAAAILEQRLAVGADGFRVAAIVSVGKPPEAEELYAIHALRGREERLWQEIKRLSEAAKAEWLRDAIQEIRSHHLGVLRPLQDRLLADLAAQRRASVTPEKLTVASQPTMDGISRLMIQATERAVWAAHENMRDARTRLIQQVVLSTFLALLLLASIRYVVRNVVKPLEQIDRDLRRMGALPGGGALGNEIERLRASAAELERSITSREKAEQRQSAMAENIPGFVFTIRVGTDGHASFPYASAGVEDLFGLRPEDIRGDAGVLRARYHPDDLSRLLDLTKESERTLAPFRIEIRIRNRDNGQSWIEIRSMPQRQADGATEWHGIMLDITERKSMENALRDSRDFLYSIIDNISDPIFVKDRRHRWIHMNQANCRLIGRTREELIGKSDFDFFPAQEAQVFWDGDEAVFESGQEFTSEEEITDSKGETRYIFTRKTLFTDAQGEKTLVGIISDFTERKRMENVLRENRELLNDAQRIAQLGSWELDLVGNALTWSDEIFRIFEIDPQQFGASYEAFLDAIHPDDHEAVNRAYANSLAKRLPYEIVHRLRMADGRIKHVHERCETYYSADGKPLRSLGTVQDITESKLLEERLIKREREFRTLAENLPDTVVRYDRDCRRIYVNSQYARVNGIPVEQVLGKTPMELSTHTAPLAPAYQEKLQRLIESGEPFETEFSWQGGDGEKVVFELRAFPEFGTGGEVASVLTVARDVSALKHSEELLRARELEFRTLAENSPDTVVRYDHDCRFVYANPKFESLLGQRLGDLRGKTPMQIPGLPDAEFFEQRVREVIETGVADEFEHPVQIVDGKAAWKLVHIVPEFEEAGRVAFVQMLSRDITALKEAERYLAESRERLRDLAMQRDSEQEAERKRLAWEVHEGVGQNLIALRINLQILHESVGNDDLALPERIRNMLAMLDETVKMVRDVTVALRPRVLDFGLAMALEWLVGEFSAQHGIVCEIDQKEAEIPMDERAATVLFRVVEETLSHIARRRGAERVSLVLELVGDACRLTVREQGNEFDETAQTEEEGFELAWIQEQITAMGGEFVMLVQPGQGAVIEATLPMRAAL